MGSQTNLRLNGAAPGDDVDFERDLALPNTTTQGYFEAFWRPGRRHQVSVNYTRIKRDGKQVTLDGQIEWGDDVFQVGAQVQGTTDSDFVSGVYRFAVVKNEKLEIGPAIGIGHIWITATLTGQAGIGVGDQGAIREVRREATARLLPRTYTVIPSPPTGTPGEESGCCRPRRSTDGKRIPRRTLRDGLLEMTLIGLCPMSVTSGGTS